MRQRNRQLRSERGWSQQDLAHRLGMSRPAVTAIEHGRYSPSLEVAFRIARVFGVPLERVFGYPEAAP